MFIVIAWTVARCKRFARMGQSQRTLALKSELCVSTVDRTSDLCMFFLHETNSTAKSPGLCTLILTACQFFVFREVTERLTILLHASRFEVTVPVVFTLLRFTRRIQVMSGRSFLNPRHQSDDALLRHTLRIQVARHARQVPS